MYAAARWIQSGQTTERQAKSTARFNMAIPSSCFFAFMLTATLAWSIWTGGIGLSQLLKNRYQIARGSVHSTVVLNSPWRLPSLGETQGTSTADGALWSFPGCNIGILAAEISEHQLSSLLADFSACPMEPRYEYQPHAAAGNTLLQLMRDGGAIRRVVDGLAVYTLHQGAFEARVIAKVSTTNDASDTFLAGVMAQRAPDDRWNVWGLTPAIATSEIDEEHYLMPLPNPSHTVCRRTTTSGETLFELVDTSTDPQVLLEEWREAGWEIRPMDGQDGSDRGGYVCEKHNNVTFVWSANGDERFSRLLLKRAGHVGTPDVSLLASRSGF